MAMAEARQEAKKKVHGHMLESVTMDRKVKAGG